MACENIVGVKNILLTFTNCETGQVTGPISHKLATEEIPKWRTYEFQSEELPGGYTKRRHISPKCEMQLIRDLRVPLADYQGRSAVALQVEYENGLVYTGANGNITGDDTSDTHEVQCMMSFKFIDELLPPGALIEP